MKLLAYGAGDKDFFNQVATGPARAAAGYIVHNAGALRGRRQGAAAPPAPPARDCVPWNPDLMRRHNKSQTHMLTGNVGQAAASADCGITKACADALIARQASNAGGSGAQRALGGEREGRLRLAMLWCTA